MSTTVSVPMSALYMKAWNKLFSEKPKGIQQIIIDEPHGRSASELAHETAKLAESWERCASPDPPDAQWIAQDDYI